MILQGNCLDVLKDFPDNSIDCCVTDPPYGLSFMGKKWDYDVPSTEIWKEVLRVLKPGAALLAFGGTRTYHRLVVNIEDAGFEIRDQLQWIYGSGFPKSLDVAKAIDATLLHGNSHPRSQKKANELSREKIGERTEPKRNNGFKQDYSELNTVTISLPSTDEAKTWQGWGTALKPANEPIVLARKPLEKGLTVAENVLKWGCGGLNIDGTRIGTDKIESGRFGRGECESEAFGKKLMSTEKQYVQGRWPANVLFDEQAAEMLDAQVDDKVSRFFYVAKASKRERNAGLEGMPERILATSTGQTRPNKPARLGADPHAVQDAVANFHPTVKPVKLMEYLITLVCPPSGIVLDPFCGSGSTGVAANNLSRDFVGVEMNPEYALIAEKRTKTA